MFQELNITTENKNSNYLLSKVDNLFSSASSTFLKNVRNDNSILPFINYNTTTKEITYKNISVPTGASYASFYNTNTFAFPVGSPVKLQFNNTFLSNGINYNVGTPSRIEFTANGIYEITIQAQLEETGGSSANVYGSLHKTGSLINNSGVVVQVQGNKAKEYEIANKIFDITDYTTEYIEFVGFTPSSGITAEAYPSPDASIGAIPSVVCNIVQIL